MTRPETPATTTSALVLLVDDDDVLRRALGRTLKAAGFDVYESPEGASALERLGKERFDVVISDLMMPGMLGTELLQQIRARDLDVPVVLMTGSPSLETAIRAIELGAMDYLTKPVDGAKLVEVVGRAAKLGRLGRVKRGLLEAAGSGGAAGDLAGLAASFDRCMETIWVAFQPIVRADGRPFGHESLMRSKEPALPHPGAVLDAAERLDRLEPMGRHLRQLTAEGAADAAAAGIVFVNLHPRDLFDPTLTEPGSGLSSIASRVVLEITERASLDNLGNAKKRSAELREHGYKIAIDDLGAGYAGLTAFAMLEPEIVKLDMTLIRDVDKNATKRTVVRTMAQLAHELGMQVVAEGVETKAELDAVVESGCDLIQGFLLAKPGPAFPTYVWPRS